MNCMGLKVDADFTERLSILMAKVEKMLEDYYTQNYSNLTPPTLEFDEGSKNLKLVKLERGGGKSVYAFIAKEDYTTKTLGNVKKGDILLPASFKLPAKHARGSLYATDYGFGAFGPHGLTCLR